MEKGRKNRQSTSGHRQEALLVSQAQVRAYSAHYGEDPLNFPAAGGHGVVQEVPRVLGEVLGEVPQELGEVLQVFGEVLRELGVQQVPQVLEEARRVPGVVLWYEVCRRIHWQTSWPDEMACPRILGDIGAVAWAQVSI